MADENWSLATRLVQAGRHRGDGLSAVNPAIQRGSTVLASSVDELYGPGSTYGLSGFQVHDALRTALSALHGAAGATLVPSGLAACTLPLLAMTQSGDHILVPDSVYGPTRRFCDYMLRRFGVVADYYDPRISAADIASMIQLRTRVLVLESPGSLTFEVQDVPGLAAVARSRGVATLLDDTWSAGVLFRAFDHGVDVVAQALTKHQAGHADVLLGAVLARESALHATIAQASRDLGTGCGSAEDAYLTLRGLRSMPLRLARQGEAALAVASALASHPAVAAVLHPAHPSHPDHAVFARDFCGPGAVFSIVLHAAYGPAVDRALESLELFGLGFSWGGFESLAIPCDRQLTRTATVWPYTGALVRLAIGLEDPADLVADVSRALSRLP